MTLVKLRNTLFFGHAVHWILAPRQGIEFGHSAVEVLNPSHWTAIEFPITPGLYSSRIE